MTTWGDLNVLLLGMRAASFIGLASMVVLPSEPQFYTAIGTMGMVAGSIVLQLLKNHEEDKRRKADQQERLDHQNELKLEIERVAVTARLAAMGVAKVAKDAASDLSSKIEANTALTLEVGSKADAAYVAANHINDKVLALTGENLVDIAADVSEVTHETNQTVHRIEDKIGG